MLERISAHKATTRAITSFAYTLGLLLASSVLYAFAQAPTAPRSMATSNLEDLSYFVPSQALSILEINMKGEAVELPFIRYSARQPIVKGVTILVSEIQAQGQIDPTLHALAKRLPDWGWHTVLITPNQDYIKAIDVNESGATETEEPNDTAIAQEGDAPTTENSQVNLPQTGLKANSLQAPSLPYSYDEYLHFLNLLNDAINKKFAQQPGYKVMYASGTSASALITLLAKSNNTQIDALIVNNPYWPEPEQNQQVPQELATLPMPVLDLVSDSDNSWAKQTAVKRIVASKVALKAMYRQRDIIGGNLGISQHDYLSKEVVSWTYSLGW